MGRCEPGENDSMRFSKPAIVLATGAVIAAGTVMVESVDKKVQHPTGGVVKEILVQDGSEVDAFLGLSRSARIAQVIPDHARACLPSEGGLLVTDAQRTIAAGVAVLAESPLGAWLIGEAAARTVLICHDPKTDLAGYYRAQMRLIGLFQQLPDPARIMFLAHELAHVPQHPRFSNDLRFGAQGMLVVHRIREAAAEAVATRILWQLRTRGHAGPWQHKLASAYGHLASAIARAMDATARTVFQAVQPETYRVQRIAPSALSGATAANPLLRGTLKTMVTPMVPTR